ncbi:Hint domain-containing protein [Paracoccus pacificus]|uniref:Hint domain-containing protein n=1 Tax=Paracoccus pacificus TaxID=1463598 RepID=A0ABW4R7C2_9RHOB
MPFFSVNVYTADSFTYTYNGVVYDGLPAESALGTITLPNGATPTATKPVVITLKPDAVPIKITIEDNDTGSFKPPGSPNTFPNSNTAFNEVSNAQYIKGGGYHPDALINGAYTMYTKPNQTGAQLVTYRLDGKDYGNDVGPVQGLISTIPLTPGESITIQSARTSQAEPLPYPKYDGGGTLPCFTSGTLILTAAGDVAVEDLRVGDLVITRDHGGQPIRWIGRRKLSADQQAAMPHLRPIHIRKDALGAGTPASDLIVSPQHRILVRSEIVLRMFGEREILVAAKHLLQLPGVGVPEALPEVEYFHILFDRHEIVFSNGAESESFYPGPEALKSVGVYALWEIHSLFPELSDPEYIAPSARPKASGKTGQKLTARHVKNGKSLVVSA